MNPEQNVLWQRLDQFRIDDPSASFTFTARLARENGWSAVYAERVVEEYKRFVFLAMTAGHEVTPSDPVDQAWHLHLTYTRSYWEELCSNTLGRRLHHNPTKGGREESSRFRDQYQRTLASYREAFGNEPPSAIWPTADAGITKSRHERVDVAAAWVIPKPWARLKRVVRPITSGATLCVAPLLVALLNPLDLIGSEFLVFYAWLLIATVPLSLLLRYVLRAGDDSSDAQLTPYQVACLAGGVPGVVRAAVVSLIDRGAIEVGRSQNANIGGKDYRLKNRRGLPFDADEIDQRIVAASNGGYGCYINDAIRAAQPAAEKIRHRLEEWGLMVSSNSLATCQCAPFLVMLGVTAVGIAKIVVGATRGKPIEYLLILTVVAAIISALFLIRPHRTRAGDVLLKRIRERERAIINHTPGNLARLGGDELIMAAALFGLPAIAAGEFALLPDAWKYRAGPNAPADSSSCGGSGCGGDGGGGGCGGGGCGGCGGD